MDTWKIVQVGGVACLVLVVSTQVWKHPGDDESHSHQETQGGPGQQIGRTAVLVTGSSIQPALGFVFHRQ